MGLWPRPRSREDDRLVLVCMSFAVGLEGKERPEIYFGGKYESKTVSEKDLSQVQGYQEKRDNSCYL